MTCGLMKMISSVRVRLLVVGVGEGFAEDGNLIENRDSGARLVLFLLDEASKQHGLTVRDT